MSDALACLLIVGLAFAYVGSWQLARRLFEHQLRLDLLEEIELGHSRARSAPPRAGSPVALRIAETPDGPDLAA